MSARIRRAPMTRADWDALYRSQRAPCDGMDSDAGATLCALREGHAGRHNTRTDGTGRAFDDPRKDGKR